MPLAGDEIPLWLAEGTSCGPRERSLINRHLGDPQDVRLVLVSAPWESWPTSTSAQLDFRFVRRDCGSVVRAYLRQPAGEPASCPLALLQLLRGNLHPAALRFGEFAQPAQSATGRNFVGTFRTSTVFRLVSPCNRLSGTAILQRHPGASAGPLSADFIVRYTRADSPGDAWRQAVNLPTGVDEVAVEYSVDARQQALEFAIDVPLALRGGVCAGWSDTRINHAQSGVEAPASRFSHPEPEHSLAKEATTAVMPPQWRTDAVILRGGSLVWDHFALPPGGELWLRSNRPLAELLGRVRIADDQPTSSMPVVRLVWCKGARIEILNQTNVRPSDRQLELRAWSAEPDGWVGILIDPVAGTPTSLVHIDSARFAE